MVDDPSSHGGSPVVTTGQVALQLPHATEGWKSWRSFGLVDDSAVRQFVCSSVRHFIGLLEYIFNYQNMVIYNDIYKCISKWMWTLIDKWWSIYDSFRDYTTPAISCGHCTINYPINHPLGGFFYIILKNRIYDDIWRFPWMGVPPINLF